LNFQNKSTNSVTISECGKKLAGWSARCAMRDVTSWVDIERGHVQVCPISVLETNVPG
jgi:hypothetical protein